MPLTLYTNGPRSERVAGEIASALPLVKVSSDRESEPSWALLVVLTNGFGPNTIGKRTLDQIADIPNELRFLVIVRDEWTDADPDVRRGRNNFIEEYFTHIHWINDARMLPSRFFEQINTANLQMAPNWEIFDSPIFTYAFGENFSAESILEEFVNTEDWGWGYIDDTAAEVKRLLYLAFSLFPTQSAQRWICSTSHQLGGVRPIDLILTAQGELFENLVQCVMWGAYL